MAIKISEQEYLGTIIQMLDISYSVKEAVALTVRDLHITHGPDIILPIIRKRTRQVFYHWIDILIEEGLIEQYEDKGDL